MKIIVDAYGGDHSPDEIVKGTLLALKEQDGFDVVLVGIEDKINELLSKEDYDKKRVSVVGASEVITCDDTPTEAIRTKPDSSIVKGVKLLREDEDAKAFVSAGSTGAVLTAAVLLSKRIRGVIRPALSPILPTITGGEVILVDCGANVDCKPQNLLQFAVMGSTYMKEIKGIKNPKVALLSNGVEDKKGCALTHEAFDLLKNAKGINFVGNMEAREILSGDYDVIVADGFYGNIALKSIEGAVKSVVYYLKKEIKSSTLAKIGYPFMKGALGNLKNTLDYNKRGGAVLLGMEKVIIKGHGSSKAEAFKNTVLQAYNNSSLNLSEQIKNNLDLASGVEQ